MPRPMWKGAVTFGLVSVPVGLYPATRRQAELSFRMLHEKDKAPIQYKKFCSEEDKEVPWNEFAVLFRGNHQSRPLEKAMQLLRIPYHLSGGTAFLERAEVKDALAWLRVLANPEDDAAFLRAITSPKREVGGTRFVVDVEEDDEELIRRDRLFREVEVRRQQRPEEPDPRRRAAVVHLIAEEKRDDERPSPAVVAFSGGVDSAFSAYHHAANAGSRRRDLQVRRSTIEHLD